jgi:hypothetical protein
LVSSVKAKCTNVECENSHDCKYNMHNFHKSSSTCYYELVLLVGNHIKNLVTSAYIWHVLESSTDGSKDIIAIEVSSVSDLVYGNLGM